MVHLSLCLYYLHGVTPRSSDQVRPPDKKAYYIAYHMPDLRQKHAMGV